ncbi:C4-type zinc ribbon domain-containing protein [Corynebacterium falsenii]|uniref:zinc ribbon domain-containing protein n=1 Tax=Corynebacterium falsenii TaxID=108486 RepID=UPI00234C46EB|nr:C4-type zinc ribbon domain-containing protein [Corynebacterium falsenii]MDC7103743.1 C4-type zinc ribbon domain-containing protein [Corynebacterium falsenii]
MRCDPEYKPYLAQLAASDDEISVLEARLNSLPEQARLDDLLEKQAQRRQQVALRRSSAREKKQSVERLRQDVGKLRARAKANVKALSAEVDRERRRDLKHDLAATHTRLAVLEERLRKADEVAAMFTDEQEESAGTFNSGHLADPIVTHTSAGEAVGDDTDRDLADAIADARRDVERAQNAIHADIQAATSRAQAARRKICQHVLDAYDRQRAEHGVGAAELKGRTCQGCFMELDPAFLREVKNSPADVVLRCPECNVLLLT